jgi:CHAT domain-containing protein
MARAQAQLERSAHRAAAGKIDAAAADLRNALATFHANDSPADEFAAWVAMAQLERRRNSLRAAQVAVDRAIALAEEVRLQSANPELRAALLQPLRPAFDLKIALLAERYFRSGESLLPRQREQLAMQALAASEQARARALADFQRLDTSASGANARLVEQRRVIYRELAERHFQLDSRRDRAPSDDARVQGIRAEIAALRARLDQTDAEIAATTLRNRGTTGPGASPAFDPRELPNDAAVIAYWLGAEDAFAWVVTREHLSMVKLDNTRAIEEKTQALQSALRDFGAAPRSLRLDTSARLYDAVLRPLAGALVGKRTLVFVPDGSLHYVSFATLRPADAGRFLVQDYDVGTAPSVDALGKARAGAEPSATPSRVLLVSDPVYSLDDTRFPQNAKLTRTPNISKSWVFPVLRSAPTAGQPARLMGTSREASTITDLLPAGDVDRLDGFTATRERFLRAGLDRYRIIHVASHAVADADIPQLSALLLTSFDASGQRIDDRVLAADLMGTRFGAELVVLSACETALGKSFAGEGLIGLRYLVLARGARAVVASLWEVPDHAAASLMKAFYTRYLAGDTSVIAALSSAMRTLLAGPSNDPSEWGAFSATLGRGPLTFTRPLQ